MPHSGFYKSVVLVVLLSAIGIYVNETYFQIPKASVNLLAVAATSIIMIPFHIFLFGLPSWFRKEES